MLELFCLRSFLQPLLGSGSLVWELAPGEFKLVDGSAPRSGVSLCENLCGCGLGCEDSGNQRSVGTHEPSCFRDLSEWRLARVPPAPPYQVEAVRRSKLVGALRFSWTQTRRPQESSPGRC